VGFVPVLRINQQRGDGPHRYRIEITATDIPNLAQRQFSRDIAFELTPQDGERIRWYLRTISNLTKTRRRKSRGVSKP
jgi:hypothetical protein